MLSSVLGSRPKPSMLPPLDLEHYISTPTNYVRTRVYTECFSDEAVFILAEWAAVSQNSIAFPELVTPIVIVLRKLVKGSPGHKGIDSVKTLVDRLEAATKWISPLRTAMNLGPNKLDAVKMWESKLKVDESPLIKWLKISKKARAKQKMAIEKV